MATSNRVGALIGFLLLPIASAVQTTPSPQTVITGRVSSSDGMALEGVVISGRLDGKSFTTSVYSDQTGQFYFPPLEAGRYRLWAQAVGFTADWAVLEIDAERRVEQNFILNPLRDFSHQLTGIEWMASLPENTPQDRRAKRIFEATCVNCHSAGFVLQNRFDAKDWDKILHAMMNMGVPDRYFFSSEFTSYPFVSRYRNELNAYLTRLRGPKPDSLRFKAFPRPKGVETQIIITEYDIPPANMPGHDFVNDGSDWSLGSPGIQLGGYPHDLAVAKDGSIWFTDGSSSGRSIGKLDPRSGRVTNFTLNDPDQLPLSTHGIGFDHHGNLWLTNTREYSIMKFDTKTEQFQRFPKPVSLPKGGGRTLEIDSRGQPWNVAAGGILTLDPTTGKYTYYKSLTTGTPGVSAGYYGLTIDRNDNVWFSIISRNRVGRVNPRTGRIDEVNLGKENFDEATPGDREFDLNVESLSISATPFHKGPRKLRADRRGNSIWVPEYMSGKLAKIDIQSLKVTEYTLPYRHIKPYAVAVDKQHMVWIGDTNSDRIYRFNPVTEQFTTYRLPALGMDVRHVEVDDSTDPPAIWFPYIWGKKIVRLQIKTSDVRGEAARLEGQNRTRK